MARSGPGVQTIQLSENAILSRYWIAKGVAMTNQRYESLAQAAARTGLSTRTLRRRISMGMLPAFTSGRRTIRLRVDDVHLMMRPVVRTGSPRAS